MLLSICYIIVFLVSLVLVTLIKKSDKPVNAIAMLFSSFVMLLSYDALCALAMTAVHIPVDLLSIMICNILLSIGAIYIIKRLTGIEKLTLSYVDLVFSLLLFITIFAVGYHIFSGFTIGYNSGDSTNHFYFAMRTLRSKKVSAMFFDPLYNALFTAICAPFIRPSRIFIPITISDTFMLFCVAEMIYLVVSQRIKSNTHKFFAFIITTLCIFGYPMYSYSVGGFLYLTCALMISCYIIYWMRQYVSDDFSKPVCLIFLITGCISLVFTYAVIAPLVIGAVIIALSIYELTKINPELRTRFLIITCSIAAVAAFMMSIIVALYLRAENQPVNIGSAISYFTQAFRSDGYMYSRVYSDLLLLFPAIIAVILKSIKEKDVFGIFVFAYTVFIIICFILCIKGYMSGYYYYKTYYVLWIIGWMCIGKWIFNSSESIAVRIAYFSTVVFICLTSFFGAENRIYSNFENIAAHHEGFVEEAKIYLRVHDSIFKEYNSWWLTDDYMELVEYSMDNSSYTNCGIVIEQNTSDVSRTSCVRAYEAITGNITKDMTEFNYDIFTAVCYDRKFTMLALFKDSPYVTEHADWFENLDVLFENDTFLVVSTNGL